MPDTITAKTKAAKLEKKLPDWAKCEVKEILDLYTKASQTRCADGSMTRYASITRPDLGDIRAEICPQTHLVTIRFMTKEGGNNAKFSLVQLYGCCGAIVSTDTAVLTGRGQGVGQMLMKLKMALAKKLGYTSMLATITSDMLAEQHILEKFGWKRGEEFVNARTSRTVIYYTRNIKDIELP